MKRAILFFFCTHSVTATAMPIRQLAMCEVFAIVAAHSIQIVYQILLKPADGLILQALPALPAAKAAMQIATLPCRRIIKTLWTILFAQTCLPMAKPPAWLLP